MTEHNPNKCYINITRRQIRKSESYSEFGEEDHMTDDEIHAIKGYFIHRPLRDLYKNNINKIRHNTKQIR